MILGYFKQKTIAFAPTALCLENLPGPTYTLVAASDDEDAVACVLHEPTDNGYLYPIDQLPEVLTRADRWTAAPPNPNKPKAVYIVTRLKIGAQV